MGTMARTAVIAGTATAVSGSVANKRQVRAGQEAELAAARQAQGDAAEQASIDAAVQRQLAEREAAVPAQAAPPATPADDPTARLQQLADMKARGLLTDEEFTAMKAKLLGL